MSKRYEVDRYPHYGTTLQTFASERMTERTAAGWKIEHTVGGDGAFIVVYSRVQGP